MDVISKMTDADTMMPTRGILLYESSLQVLATVHPIQIEENATFTLLPGQLLRQEAFSEMVRAMEGGVAGQRTILPANLLCWGGGRMVWHVPSQRRPIFFNTSDKEFNQTMNGQTVLHPALLFMAQPGLMRVWALAWDTRPTMETPLYRAPYYNLYEGGNMCSGSVRLPERAAPSTMAEWESVFYDTNFTHSNLHGKPLTTHSGGHKGFWQTMMNERNPKPATWLAPIQDWTVGKAINQGANEGAEAE